MIPIRRAIAMTAWAVVVLAVALVFGGSRVAQCLGGPGTTDACVAAWETSHPRTPAIFDTTLAWPWIGLFIAGVFMIQTFSRWRPVLRHRRPLILTLIACLIVGSCVLVASTLVDRPPTFDPGHNQLPPASDPAYKVKTVTTGGPEAHDGPGVAK